MSDQGELDAVISVIFDGTSPTEQPTLTLVIGAPGAGKSRSVPRSLAADRAAVVSTDDLAAYDPNYLELTRRRPLDAPSAMSSTVAELLTKSVNHARTTKRSTVIDATINTPQAAIGTAASFEAAGFATQLVVVASRQSQSLLTTASRYMNARRLGTPARFVDVETHRRGWIGTGEVARAVAASDSVQRLTILGRGGATLFNATRAEGFGDAAAAYDSALRADVTTLEGAEWFGELRRVTEFARESRELSPPVAAVLVELHQLALNEVLPSMAVRRQSAFAVAQEARLTAELVSLKREIPREAPRVDPAAPIFAPQGPQSTGPSL